MNVDCLFKDLAMKEWLGRGVDQKEFVSLSLCVVCVR